MCLFSYSTCTTYIYLVTVEGLLCSLFEPVSHFLDNNKIFSYAALICFLSCTTTIVHASQRAGLCPEITSRAGRVRLLKGSPTFPLLQQQGQVSEAADDRTEESEQELLVFSSGAIRGGFTEIPLQG